MDENYFYCDGLIEYADGRFEAVMVNNETDEAYFCEATDEQIKYHTQKCETCQAYLQDCDCDTLVDWNFNTRKVKRA